MSRPNAQVAGRDGLTVTCQSKAQRSTMKKKMIFMSGAVALSIASGVDVAAPASATPPCQTN